MKVELYLEDKKIAKFDFFLCIGPPLIENLMVLDKENMPFELKNEKRKEFEMQKWIGNRVIPNNTKNLDNCLISIYGLNPGKFGRMYGYQHIGAILSYYLSKNDNYYILPENDDIITFFDQDISFDRIFFLQRKNWKEIEEIKNNPDPEIEKYFTTEKIIPMYEKYDYFPTTLFCI